MNIYTLRRGFTLIELLVVIAIIGILSSVVLASLNTARAKAVDAKIEGELDAVKKTAEIYYADNANTYGPSVSDCTSGMFAATDPNMAQIVRDLSSATPTADPVCNVDSTTNAYAIQHQLTAPSSATYVCVESTGKISTSTTALGTATVCP